MKYIINEKTLERIEKKGSHTKKANETKLFF